MLTNFGPLILDWLEVFYVHNGNETKWDRAVGLRSQLFETSTPFVQRLKYFPSEHDGWRSNVGWAICYTISVLKDKLASILPIIAGKEYRGEFNRDGFVRTILKYIESELEDPMFRRAVEESKSWKDEIPARYVRNVTIAKVQDHFRDDIERSVPYPY